MSPDATRRSEASRRAILDATSALLAEVGFVRLTVEAIAKRAGAGKQTIYRWWPSKGAVVFDALLLENANGASSENANGDSAVRLPDTGDIVADLRAVLQGSIAELTDPQRENMLRTITAEVQHDPVLAGELTDRLMRPQFDATIERIRAGQQAGQIEPGLDPRIVMETLYGAVLHRWLLRTAPFDDDYVEKLLEAVIKPPR